MYRFAKPVLRAATDAAEDDEDDDDDTAEEMADERRRSTAAAFLANILRSVVGSMIAEDLDPLRKRGN